MGGGASVAQKKEALFNKSQGLVPTPGAAGGATQAEAGKAAGTKKKIPPKPEEIFKGKFQVMLNGKWKDYGPEEDSILKRAYLVGHSKVTFNFRGQDYEYSFKDSLQKNLRKEKERKIRVPPGMPAPEVPILPPGPTVALNIPSGSTEHFALIDPNNRSRTLQVAIPPGAKPGMKLAVPVPKKGEKVELVVKRQRDWKTGAITAPSLAASDKLTLCGMILGESLCGGFISGWGQVATDEPEAPSVNVADVADLTDVGVSEKVEGAADAAAEGAEGAADAAAEKVEGAAGAAADVASAAAGAAAAAVGGDVGGDAGEPRVSVASSGAASGAKAEASGAGEGDAPTATIGDDASTWFANLTEEDETDFVMILC